MHSKILQPSLSGNRLEYNPPEDNLCVSTKDSWSWSPHACRRKHWPLFGANIGNTLEAKDILSLSSNVITEACTSFTTVVTGSPPASSRCLLWLRSRGGLCLAYSHVLAATREDDPAYSHPWKKGLAKFLDEQWCPCYVSEVICFLTCRSQTKRTNKTKTYCREGIW